MRQILFDLIGNAIKFTEMGKITVRARRLAAEPESVTLALTTRRYGGAGLGLSIVNPLAELMDGNVTVESAPGMDGYLTKPLTLDRLREALARWMSAPSEAPVPSGDAKERDAAIDLGVVRNLFGDNQAMVDRVLARFANAGAKLVDDIVAAGEGARRSELAHKLKGAARAAGAVRLGDLAAALETSGDRSDVAPLVAEWKRVLVALSPSPG